MFSIGGYLSDTSDSDEEGNASFMRASKRMLRDNSNLLEIPDREFVKNFRVSKRVFKLILDEMSQHMASGCRSSKVAPIHKLSAFLRFLATGSYQKGVENEFLSSMSQPMVSNAITECLEIFETNFCPNWIKLRMTEEEESAAKENFYVKCGIPGIVGCVDGTHVKIKCPSEDTKHLYYNRKGYYSINAMI
ncbi:uncharacterized protein LOC118750930, partial [Rhagoletis pomonella]|uniref:uncharacterized protein LOC118750930 n=1 Tax=Rhagoletis pomonella TaxID=28610 RepID=UPI001780CA5D